MSPMFQEETDTALWTEMLSTATERGSPDSYVAVMTEAVFQSPNPPPSACSGWG